jgi:hypothetical protein
VEIKRGCTAIGARTTLHPHRISLNKIFAEVELTHEPCPLCQNHVIIHSGFGVNLPSHWLPLGSLRSREIHMTSFADFVVDCVGIPSPKHHVIPIHAGYDQIYATELNK